MLCLTSTGPTFLLVCHKHQSGDKWEEEGTQLWMQKNSHYMWRPWHILFAEPQLVVPGYMLGSDPRRVEPLRLRPTWGLEDLPKISSPQSSPHDTQLFQDCTTVTPADDGSKPNTSSGRTTRPGEHNERAPDRAQGTGLDHKRGADTPRVKGGPTAGDGQAAVTQGAQPPPRHAQPDTAQHAHGRTS